MPYPIPDPSEFGTTTTTPIPLYWVRYRGDQVRDVPRESLIVLHGGPGADHRYLLPQMLHLAERYDLIFYDQRGSGKSRADDNTPITWQDHVADLGLVAKELGVDRPSIVGYSWGGMLASLYAIEASKNPALPQPDRIVLLSPAPANKAYRAIFDDAMRRRGTTPEIAAERQALMDSGLRDTDPDAYRQRLFELGVTAYFADPADARELTPFRVVGRVQQSTWDSLGDYNLLPQLSQIHVPVLIVHGRQDPIPVESSLDMARELGTEVVLIDDCGHVPYVEQPTQLWAAIDPFLASTDPLPRT